MKPRILAFTVASLLASAAVHAQTWDGGGSTGGPREWSLGSNWTGVPDNTVPVNNGTAIVIFAGANDTNPGPNMDANWSVNSLTFNPGAGAFLMSSISQFTLTVGTGGIVNNSSNIQVFNHPVSLNPASTSTINAASAGLTINGAFTLSTATLALQGSNSVTINSSIAGTGTINKNSAGSLTFVAAGVQPLSADFNLNAGSTSIGLTGLAQSFTSTSTIAVNGTSSLSLPGNITLDGAQLTRASGATLNLPSASTLTVQNAGGVAITGGLTLGNFGSNTATVTGIGSTFTTTGLLQLTGATMNVAAGGSVSTGSALMSIGNGISGTVTVSGTGSSLAAGAVDLGVNAPGNLTFSGGSTGAIANLLAVNPSAGAGAGGTLNVQTGASVTAGSLIISPSPGGNPTGTVTISGANSALTVTGAGTTAIGAASGNTGALNVQSGGTFNSGTGTTTVNATGSINITGGTFNANGDVIVNRGLTRDATGVFNLAAGKALTLQNGGDAIFIGGYNLTTAATVNVTGAGATVTMSGPSQFRGGSTLNITAGGSVTNSGSYTDLAYTGGNATVLVDGTGSTFSADGTIQSDWGNAGGTALVTFSNGSFGAFGPVTIAGGGVGSVGTVNVQSGALLSLGTLRIADTTASATGSLTVTGAQVQQIGPAALTVGGSGGSTGTLTIGGGATFTTGTGTATVNPTGALVIADGTFTAAVDVLISGGQLTRDATGILALAPGKKLSITAGGDATFTGELALEAPMSPVEVSGHGSTLTVTEDLRTAANVTLSNSASAALGSLKVNPNEFALAGTAVTFSVLSGADVTVLDTDVGSNNSGNTCTLLISGPGSTYTETGPVGLFLGRNTVFVPPSSGTLTVADGGTYTSSTTGFSQIFANGTLNILGGTAEFRNPLLTNGTINFPGAGTLKLVDNFTVGGGGLLGANLALGTGRGFATTATTTIDGGNTLTVNGGSFSTGALVNNGAVAFTSGTFAITGAGGIEIDSGVLGANVTLSAGSTLQVTSTATLASGAALTLNGGVFTAGALANFGTLRANVGTTSLGAITNASGGRIFAGDMLTASGAWTNAAGSQLTLQNGALVNGAGAMTNSGLITGDGVIANAFTNASGGEVRGEFGKTLAFTGALGANAGRVNLLGGTVQFAQPFTNAAGGQINGQGNLYFPTTLVPSSASPTAGLMNAGSINLSGGDSQIYGTVQMQTGSRLIVSGGATASFFDVFRHSGLEVKASAGSAVVFFGDVRGAGSFTGTGTVYFEAGYSPGNSPAAVSSEGDLVFGGASTLTLEIGGLTEGAQYDHLDVAGTLHADGLLKLSLLDGFIPAPGDTFDLLDAGAFTGAFDTIAAPALPGDLAWDFTALASTGVVTVVPEPGIGALLAGGLALLGLRRRRGAHASRRGGGVRDKWRMVGGRAVLVSASRRNELPGASEAESASAFRTVTKVRGGGTPPPTRETHVLPGVSRAAFPSR